MDFISRIVIET